MADLHPILDKITNQIIQRSKPHRTAYLNGIESRIPNDFSRQRLSAGNQAHAYAGCSLHDKQGLMGAKWPNIGIISAYNDMLSAHQPFEKYPDIIRSAVRSVGATAQFAGGVPAMCDGVTQGQTGMELSLFSRDVIAMASAIALSHDTFDAALYLGVCDKIIPGLLIGALHFGHVPGVFIPAGPMPSGLPNKEKIRIRQLFAQGKIERAELLKAECESYHSPGTCTFYGTANSNQMLMEIMGLHIPGAAFVGPSTPIRQALTEHSAIRATQITAQNDTYTPIGKVVSEKSIVNAIVGLMATGGSTNLILHIPAIAKAAGIDIRGEDFAHISEITPLLARIYPNGQADVNHFHAAGGMGYLIDQLLQAGLLHEDVFTVAGHGLSHYTREPFLNPEQSDTNKRPPADQLVWRAAPIKSGDDEILRPADTPFHPEGGLHSMGGNLGKGVMKISAVKEAHHFVKAPAIVFNHQDDVMIAFEAGELEKDFIAVLRFQGPSANGMPELHKLMPPLGVLQDKGFKVALVTDGRLSGASGKIPSAIHISPEAAQGGPLSRVQDGDMITLDAKNGVLQCAVDADEFMKRTPAILNSNANVSGFGRGLFSSLRGNVSTAETGATSFDFST